MDKITTLKNKLISDKIFDSLRVNNKKQEYYDELNVINTYYDRTDGTIRQFFSSISEFIPSYITSLVYPDIYQYTTTSDTKKALVEKTIKDLNGINNNIKTSIQEIKNKNKKLGEGVDKEDEEHDNLKGEYQDKTAINNGSDLLFNESINLYKIQYLINLFIILGVIILIISLYQIYKNK
jgi:hypothetical protein